MSRKNSGRTITRKEAKAKEKDKKTKAGGGHSEGTSDRKEEVDSRERWTLKASIADTAATKGTNVQIAREREREEEGEGGRK